MNTPPPAPVRSDLLEEYKAINEMARSDTTLAWTSIGLFVPAATAILAFVANHQFEADQEKELGFFELVAFCVLSLSLWMVGFVIAGRFKFFARQRFTRAQEIERLLGLHHHLAIAEADEQGRPFWLRLGIMGALGVFGLLLGVSWLTAILYWQDLI
jgi:hypothetical protein